MLQPLHTIGYYDNLRTVQQSTGNINTLEFIIVSEIYMSNTC